MFNRGLVDVKKICSSDDASKMKIIKNRHKYNLSLFDLLSVASSISSDDCKKQIVDYLLDNNFSYDRISSVICSIKDDNYKNLLVRNYESFGIDKSVVFEIIDSMSESAIKRIIFNHLLYPFTDRDLVKMVSFIDDDNFKINIISDYKYYCFDSEDIANVISSLSSDIHKKSYITHENFYSFDSYSKSIIISSIKDDEFKYGIITNYKAYDFDDDDVVFIIDSLNNKSKYVTDFVNNYEEYGFNDSILAGIVCLMSDDTKENILLNNSYGFSPFLICQILKSVRDCDERGKFLNKLYFKGFFGDLKTDRHICIPSDMTVGIEIESEGKNSSFIDTDIIPRGWDIHEEASLNRGTEVVSSILNAKDEREIVKVCALLQSLLQVTNKNCAGHIHIGADYFDNDVDNYKVLLELFANVEGILFLISNAEGTIPRDRVFMYSSPVSSKISNMITNGEIDFNEINDVDSFSSNVHAMQEKLYKPRYSSINFENLGNPHKNTIEFRMPNGSLDQNVWIDNINLYGSLMWVSKKIANVMKRTFSDMSDDDKISMYFYEKLKDVNISERDKLKCLLNLFPSSLDKKVYLNRYDVNSELVKGLDVDDILKDLSSFGPINVTTCSAELRNKVNMNYRNLLRCKKVSRSR